MNRLPAACLPLVLALAGCMSDDGEGISRPADQGFGGSDRPEDEVVMTHRFTAVGLAGTYDHPVTVTLNGAADADPADAAYRIELPADGSAFPADPGLGGAAAGGTLTLQVVDRAGTITTESVRVEFNP